jgi:hypothetical protein
MLPADLFHVPDDRSHLLPELLNLFRIYAGLQLRPYVVECPHQPFNSHSYNCSAKGKKAKGKIILHLSFYICNLSLKKRGSSMTNDKCKM